MWTPKQIADFISANNMTLKSFIDYNQEFIKSLSYMKKVFYKNKPPYFGFTNETYGEINRYLGTYKRGKSATQTSDGIFIS